MKYISRVEILRAIGYNPRETGKCNDAWDLFALQHRNGVEGLEACVAGGIACGLNEGNLRWEYPNWENVNFGDGSRVRKAA